MGNWEKQPNIKINIRPIVSVNIHLGLSHSSEKPLTGGKKQATNKL